MRMPRLTSACSWCAAFVTLCSTCCWAFHSVMPQTWRMHKGNVLRSSRSLQINREEWSAASLHYQRIIKQASCHIPQPMLVRVKDIYQDRPHKTYKPHCTVLHRCTNATGCCGNDAKICVPKSIEEVKLYFQVEELFPNGTRIMKPEGLVFTNHTECMCDEKNDLPR